MLHRTFELAEPYDLSYTMTAIAWQESNFGKYRVGRITPDYGVYQININTFKRRYFDELERYRVPDDRLIYLLTNDDDLGFIAAIAEITFWKSVRGNNWRAIWGSYNGGYNMNEAYADAIAKKVRALEIYIRSN
ncbi:MAG: hypothetical protein U9Q40_06795 [Campylobacterota bacterium]|nr:hypothetical protein [Campylobacterota bacterium]